MISKTNFPENFHTEQTKPSTRTKIKNADVTPVFEFGNIRRTWIGIPISSRGPWIQPPEEHGPLAARGGGPFRWRGSRGLGGCALGRGAAGAEVGGRAYALGSAPPAMAVGAVRWGLACARFAHALHDADRTPWRPSRNWPRNTCRRVEPIFRARAVHARYFRPIICFLYWNIFFFIIWNE